MSTFLNFALFGLGRAGQFHLKNLASHPRCRLLHVVDVDKERADAIGNKYHCKSSTSPEEALKDPQVHAVIIATPTHTHYELLLKSIEAGKSIFTEKPVSINLHEIDEVYNLAKAKNVPILCGFNRRFDRSWQKVKEAVRRGDIGQAQIIRSTARDSPVPSVEYLKTSHGFFHDSGVHDIDVLRWVLGEEPTEVYSITESYLPEIKNLGDVDTIIMVFRFKSGCMGTIDMSRKSVYGYDQRLEVFGNKGLVQVQNPLTTTASFSSENGVLSDNIQFSFPQRFAEAYFRELESFVSVILDKAPAEPHLWPTHTDVRNVHIIADAARDAANKGHSVKINYDLK
jgi:myo-inositol 2-dehydrogenase/D-chiro-inositol 1-dehydrogenase